MKINIKRLSFFSAIILVCLALISIPVYAALSSSQFLTKAQNFININCSKRSIDNETSLLCYLFYKTGEININLTNTQNTVAGLTTIDATQSAQINDLKNSLTSISAQPSKAIKVIDANNNELGLLVDKIVGGGTIFVPSINKLINLESWEVQKTSIEYTTDDCTGTPYIPAGSNSDPWNYVVSSMSSRKYYTSSPSEIPTARTLNSQYELTKTNTESCSKIGPSVSLTVPAVLITIPFSEPIAQPVQFRYQ